VFEKCESRASVSLIAEEVRNAAQKLAEGILAGTTVERSYAADDPFVEPFLKAVTQGNDAQALAALRFLLWNNPYLLEHPYVWVQFRRLFTLFHPLYPEMTDQAQEQLVKLIQAWAEGMTLGRQVTIRKTSRGRKGQKPELFPHIDEKEGWLATPRALKELYDAAEFLRAYEDLMGRLASVRWRSLRRRYSQNRAAAVYDLADAIARIFEEFKRSWKITTETPQDRVQDIARAGLSVPAGRNPRHKVACALLATLPWYNLAGHPLKLRPTLVKSTVETLRKRGIEKYVDRP
jgi:hypothetical protein